MIPHPPAVRWLRRLAAVAALALAAPGAFAGEPPPAGGDNPDWEAACQAGGQAWRVRFTSASGDALNDDMGVALLHPSGRALPLPLPPAFYESAASLRPADSACDLLGGRLLAPGRLALLLSRNGRPSWSWLDLVLVDLENFRVLDRRLGVAEIKTDKLVLRPRAGSTAFDVRLVRGMVDKPECDCADVFIEGWMRVSLERGRLRTRWVAD